MKINPVFVLYFLLPFMACQPATDSKPSTDTDSQTSQKENQEVEDKKVANCWETTEKYAPSKFSAALRSLENSTYQYEVISLEEVGKKQTMFNKGMGFINAIRTKRKEPIVDTLTMNGIVAMQKALIKGKVPMTGNTYPRAEIEEWEFKSADCVQEALGTIARIRLLIPWDRVSKSPMDYWQIDNKLYFLVPGGFYMLEEAKNIQTELRKNL